RVGMEKQQHVPGGGGCAGIHLPGAARRGGENLRRWRGLRDRPVQAAAVRDQDFAEGRMAKGSERRTDVLGFVEGGDDDRNGHSCVGRAGGWGGEGGLMRRAGFLEVSMK